MAVAFYGAELNSIRKGELLLYASESMEQTPRIGNIGIVDEIGKGIVLLG